MQKTDQHWGTLNCFFFSTQLCLEFKIKQRTLSWVLRVPQSKFDANWSRGSWIMIEHTNQHQNRDYYFSYIEDFITIHLLYLSRLVTELPWQIECIQHVPTTWYSRGIFSISRTTKHTDNCLASVCLYKCSMKSMGGMNKNIPYWVLT